jgi:2-oxoisovalerate dehydrogenase E2 component (dihydrolipoyl transacylase)
VTLLAPEVQSKPLAKPPVRALAKQLGVDLASVPGTGPEGSVTREDLQLFADEPVAQSPTARVRSGERETRVPVKGVRKMTAQAMVTSAFTAPHVTEFVTVDVTHTMRLVERLKADREFEGVKVSPLLILAKALVLAVQRHPEINASWDEAAQEIVIKHYVNLGIAAATPRGLVVPNITDADAMSLRELADALSALTATAREGRTQPAQMTGGTITITNVGVFGIDTGTPILNPGEAAILAFGAVRQQPWVHRGKVKPRWVTTLALSFDHRLVDGELGSRFLADLAAVLEHPAQALVWS